MNLIKILEPNFKFADDRGSLVQLVREGFKQVNVIESNKGARRGGHYHKENVEAFFIVRGKLVLKVWQVGMISTLEEHEFKQGDFFLISPQVAHDFEFVEDTLLISMYSNGVELENGDKDIISI